MNPIVPYLAGEESQTEVLVRPAAMHAVVQVAVITCPAVFQEGSEEHLPVLLRQEPAPAKVQPPALAFDEKLPKRSEHIDLLEPALHHLICCTKILKICTQT